ncbi:MAG: S-adenosylmethionine decarboxylase [Gemmatimonadaceae bacterium]|nr:S-adenosylmethionine decarboxylase [Gemmatimonadaceae bacterium]
MSLPEGQEWVVEAHGCDPVRLADPAALQHLFADIIDALALHPVGEPRWHQFPSPGGVTGMVLLAESHLTVHTFPEFGSACFNLFCCRPRPEWNWSQGLVTHLGAQSVQVRQLTRAYATVAASLSAGQSGARQA